MEDQSRPSRATCGSWWRLPVLLAIVLAGIFFSRDRLLRELPSDDVNNTGDVTGKNDARQQVSVTIDFGSGKTKQFDRAPWHDDATVADVLAGLPNLAIQQRGAGAMAFLISIDGVANDDAAGRYWTYSVNGKSADRSFAIYKLRPGDHVLWTFGSRQ